MKFEEDTGLIVDTDVFSLNRNETVYGYAVGNVEANDGKSVKT